MKKYLDFKMIKFFFLYNSRKINKNENQAVEKFFGYSNQATINVFEVQNLMGKLQFI